MFRNFVSAFRQALREWKRARWRQQRLARIRSDNSLPF